MSPLRRGLPFAMFRRTSMYSCPPSTLTKKVHVNIQAQQLENWFQIVIIILISKSLELHYLQNIYWQNGKNRNPNNQKYQNKSHCYPSVSCTGVCSRAVGSILSSRSLLNSKASSTRNGFNNMSFLPHKTTQAPWEAKRFTSLRPCALELFWLERRLRLRLRVSILNGRGLESLAGLLLLGGWAEKSLSRACWLARGALRFTPWALFNEELAFICFLPSAHWPPPSVALFLWRLKEFRDFSALLSYLKSDVIQEHFVTDQAAHFVFPSEWLFEKTNNVVKRHPLTKVWTLHGIQYSLKVYQVDVPDDVCWENF